MPVVGFLIVGDVVTSPTISTKSPCRPLAHVYVLLSRETRDRPKNSVSTDATKHKNLFFLVTKSPVIPTTVEIPNNKKGSVFFAISVVPKYEPSEDVRPIVASGDQAIFGGLIVGIFFFTLRSILWAVCVVALLYCGFLFV